MNYKINIYLLLVFTFNSLRLSSQNLQQQINNYTQVLPQENLYVHFDRNSYFKGDTMWFKAYLMNNGLETDTLSKTLYINAYDEDGNILSQDYYPIINATSVGQLSVPKNYIAKSITIRAYTKWMLNFGNDFIFEKRISILNNYLPSTSKRTSTNSYSLEFFPEGGNLIVGIKAKVAFLCYDIDGKPVKISGVIKNQKGALISNINTQHDGMGYFMLTPEVGEQYYAEWNTRYGTLQKTNLPLIQQNGISLSLNLKNEKCEYRVQRSNNTDDKLKKITIIGMVYNQLVYMANLNIEKGQELIKTIPLNTFPSGIMQVTVFNAEKIPMAERIIFVNNKKYAAHVSLQMIKKNIGKRQQNILSVSISDSLLTNMSLSVTDASLPADYNENIVSYLLLSSQLKGKVYNPTYYFSNNDDSVNNHLDLVMLTYGWRRYNWKSITKNEIQQTKYYRDSTYLFISGNLSAVNKKYKTGETIFIMLKEPHHAGKEQVFSFMVPIAADGSFKSQELMFMDTLLAFYSFPNTSAKLYNEKIKFDKPILAPLNVSFSRDTNRLASLLESSDMEQIVAYQNKRPIVQKAITLDEVIITTSKNTLQQMDKKYAGNNLFSGINTKGYNVMNDPAAKRRRNIFEYITSLDPRYSISRSKGIVSLCYGNPPVLVRIYLDQVETDQTIVNDYPLDDIAYIKTSGKGDILLNEGAVGVFTKKGEDIVASNSKNIRELYSEKIVGYSVIKEFYSPDYTLSESNTTPDYRNTLYWNPNISLDADNLKKEVHFFNNDMTTSFRIILQGVNKNGQLVHIDEVIE